MPELSHHTTFDLYAWKSPRDLDGGGAEALLDGWHAEGGDPSSSPFEPSTDVGWFYRELKEDAPGLDTASDAVPSASATPIWLSSTDEQPARMVGVRLSSATSYEVLDSIFALAAKYDLVLFDARSRRVHLPLEEMGAYADATFWPSGAIQAAVAGGIGGAIALAAWWLWIPVLSWLLLPVGGFMFVMAVYTFVHEGRKALKPPATNGESPPAG